MRRVIVIGLAVGALVTSGCRDPTQITLTIRTNAVCTDVAGTAISVGGPDEVESQAPTTTTSSCTPDPEGGDIGSLVLVPANADDAAVGVKVTLSVGDTLDTCLAPPYDDCIVARRSLRYIAHTPLTLPIELSLDCQGKFCDALTTCVNGDCVDARIDPNDCIDPAGCEPAPPDGGAGGTGGGGGAGGAGGGEPAPCGQPASHASDQITNLTAQGRGHVVIAADPSTCGWGVAWAEGNQACLQALRADGKPNGALSCGALDNEVDDVAVATLGDAVFAVGAWSSAANSSRLWIGGATTTTNLPFLETDVVSGALAARGNSLIVLSERESGSLHHVTYTWAASSLTEGQSGLLSTSGRRPNATFSGDDLLLSWLEHGPASQGSGFVARLNGGNWSTSGAHLTSAISEIVMANHTPSNVAGFIKLDTGFAAELGTLGPTGDYFSGGSAANNYSETTTSLSIAGTATGWVVGFVDDGKAWLTPFDDEAMRTSPQQRVAPDATSMAVAAIGDQLAVTWIDTATNVHFRLLDANLTGL